MVYYTVSAAGLVSPEYPVDVSRPQMMHDFAITESYAVFIDHALVFDPKAMVRNNSLPFVMDKSRSSRIGLLRRADPEAAMRWFDVDPFVCFHTATAWDDGDMVHLVLCRCAPTPSEPCTATKIHFSFGPHRGASSHLRVVEHTCARQSPASCPPPPVRPL